MMLRRRFQRGEEAERRQTRLDAADDAELGRVAPAGAYDADEAVDEVPGKIVAELVDQGRALVGAAEHADQGERDGE